MLFPLPGMPFFSLPPCLADTCSSSGRTLAGTSSRKPSLTQRHLMFQMLNRPCCNGPRGWDTEGHVRDNDIHLIMALFWVVICWYLSSTRL